MFDELTLDVFLQHQMRLFPKPVAKNRAEAEDFLEDMMAEVCSSAADVRETLEEFADVSDLTDKQLLSSEEVFPLGDGRYLVVAG